MYIFIFIFKKFKFKFKNSNNKISVDGTKSDGQNHDGRMSSDGQTNGPLAIAGDVLVVVGGATHHYSQTFE